MLEELAFAFVKAQAAQHVLYTEVRYSPHMLLAGVDYSFDEEAGATAGKEAFAGEAAAIRRVVDAVTRGLERGCAAHPGITVNQILCLIDGKPKWADGLTALATQLYEETKSGQAGACPVVGVDIAAGEAHFTEYLDAAARGGATSANAASHMKAMRACAHCGLGLTNHAGESGPAEHVAAAASEAYGSARRIGHGYAAVGTARQIASDRAEAIEAKHESPRALASAFATLGLGADICFECCPTSSVATGGWEGGEWTEHPVAYMSRMHDAAEVGEAGGEAGGVKLPCVSISSDDPSVFGITLTSELQLACDEMGLSDAAIKRTMIDAVGAAFLTRDGKRQLRERLEVAWSQWEQGNA